MYNGAANPIVVYVSCKHNTDEARKQNIKSGQFKNGNSQFRQPVKTMNQGDSATTYDCKKCGRHPGPRSCPVFNQQCRK